MDMNGRSISKSNTFTLQLAPYHLKRYVTSILTLNVNGIIGQFLILILRLKNPHSPVAIIIFHLEILYHVT